MSLMTGAHIRADPHRAFADSWGDRLVADAACVGIWQRALQERQTTDAVPASQAGRNAIVDASLRET